MSIKQVNIWQALGISPDILTAIYCAVCAIIHDSCFKGSNESNNEFS
jgi:hypothetical protein